VLRLELILTIKGGCCCDFAMLFYGTALIFLTVLIFTALHAMQTRYSEENSVRPSVRLSVTRVIPDKMEERSVQIYIPYERTFISLF